MNHTCSILILHVFITVFVIIISCGVCGVWWFIINEPNDIEDIFRNSETLQLLQIVIGFTYISVINSFFQSLQEKTALLAEIRATYRMQDKSENFNKFLDTIIEGQTNVDEWENEKDIDSRWQFLDTIIGKIKHANKWEKENWHYWSEKKIDSRWQPVFTRIMIQFNADHGQLFSFLGPWMALAVFYLVHPAVAYTNGNTLNVISWYAIYSISISILFAFLITMWFVERAALCFPLKYLFGNKGLLLLKHVTLQHYMRQQTKHMLFQKKTEPINDIQTNGKVDGFMARNIRRRMHLKL